MKQMLYKSVKVKKGFSLLELLLVMGTVAAIIIAAFIIYPKVMAHVRVNNELKNITTIMTGVKELYQGKADYEGFTLQTLIKAKIPPSNMLIAGNNNALKNSWMGYVSMSVSGVGIANGKTLWNAVVLSTGSVPTEDCIRLANEIYTTYNTGLSYLVVNSTYLYSTGVKYSFDSTVAACAKTSPASVQMGLKI